MGIMLSMIGLTAAGILVYLIITLMRGDRQ